MASSVPEFREPVTGDIRHATTKCISSFKACLSIKPLMKESWAESRLADLNLWASGVGALARPEASLDRRLQFLPKPRLVLTNLLLTLQEFVNSCLMRALYDNDIPGEIEPLDREAGSEDDISVSSTESAMEPSLDDNSNLATSSASWFTALESDLEARSDVSNDSEEGHESDKQQIKVTLKELMQDVDDLIDQLIMLGFAIRKSGTAARLYKADASFNPDENEDLRKHLEFILFNRTAWKQGNEEENRELTTRESILGVASAHGVTAEQQHLILANLRRRHRFRYARRHHQKLDESKMQSLLLEPKSRLQTTGNPQETSPRDERSRVSSGRKSSQTQDSSSKRLTTASPRTAQPLEMSATMPSSVGSDPLRIAIHTSTAASRVSVSVTTMHYPSPPPSKPPLKRGFKCPCCYQTLPEMFKDWSRWRKHLAEDLCPYTCPFIECSKPEVLYISRAAWRDHILQNHGEGEIWECLICADIKAQNTFWSVEEFVNHNRTTHKDSISEDQIISLQDTCCKIAPPNISRCPLCPWFQDEEMTPDAAANLEHVGNCIHEFSLNALPWAESSAIDYTNQISSTLGQTIEEWLNGTEEEDNINIQKIDIKKFCFIPTPPTPFKQNTSFVPEEYFAESSKMSSQGTRESSLLSADLLGAIETLPDELSTRTSEEIANNQAFVYGWKCCQCEINEFLWETSIPCTERDCQHPRCRHCTIYRREVVTIE